MDEEFSKQPENTKTKPETLEMKTLIKQKKMEIITNRRDSAEERRAGMGTGLRTYYIHTL